ncbi:hypothetical protein C3V41_03180 [Actinomyces sp. oral taxon 897]|nr:hypothetical protein C3V41_03180 [Actinomyces sp. oral taxon 897]
MQVGPVGGDAGQLGGGGQGGGGGVGVGGIGRGVGVGVVRKGRGGRSAHRGKVGARSPASWDFGAVTRRRDPSWRGATGVTRRRE